MKKLLALFVVVLGFSAVSFGQAVSSANATASATIVKPFLVNKIADLKFGNILVTGVGTVVITPNGTGGAPSYTSGAAPYGITGIRSEAQFEVEGSPDAHYTISGLPATSIDVTNAGGAIMKIDNFKTFPDLTAGVLGTDGKQIIGVGATLNVTNGQAAGLYTNAAAFKVTVDYN